MFTFVGLSFLLNKIITKNTNSDKMTKFVQCFIIVEYSRSQNNNFHLKSFQNRVILIDLMTKIFKTVDCKKNI